MMMLRSNRTLATGGGFGVSLTVHAALILLLFLLLRAGSEGVDSVMDELTEIAYIEARYGEDVAKQVRLKTKPVVKPEPEPEPAKTEKAPEKPVEKPAETPKPETPKLETVDVKAKLPEAPKPEFKMAEPKLQNRQRLMNNRPAMQTRSALKNKPVAEINAPKLTPAQKQQFLQTTDRRLDPKKFRDATAPNVDTSNLRNRDQLAALDGPAKLESRSPSTTPAFEGGNVALVGRKSDLDLNDVDFEVSSGAGATGGALSLQLATGGVEGGHAGLVGGQLEQGQVAYQGAVENLLPTRSEMAERQRAAEAILDTPVPAGSDKGRRTLLDYGGTVGGGGGPALRSREPAVAEPAAPSTIVDESVVEEEPVEVAEVKSALTSEKGVSMTITGQIANRKILKSVLPEYSSEARKRGWEGVVAVHFTVRPDGSILENMYFEQTSAHRDLNRAAMAAIRNFRFEPLKGSRLEQWGVITFVFRLN